MSFPSLLFSIALEVLVHEIKERKDHITDKRYTYCKEKIKLSLLADDRLSMQKISITLQKTHDLASIIRLLDDKSLHKINWLFWYISNEKVGFDI